MITFDPTWPVETHMHADACDGAIAQPLVWTPAIPPRDPEIGIWRCVFDDSTLVEWTAAARDVVKLPLSGVYYEVARETLFELEAAVAVRLKRWKQRTVSDWMSADLVAEVEAVAGTGKQVRDEFWFRCPFHEGDRTPSLHVNGPKHQWKCFGCGRGGGHVDWRREAESKSRKIARPSS